MLNPRSSKHFQAANNVKTAKILIAQPDFVRRERLTGARAQGMRYERKALDKLGRLIAERGGTFIRSPWIEFFDDSGKRWCQPDGLLLSGPTSGIVYEIKYRHTADAWFQIWRLYVPVLERIYPGVKWEGCEVCKWFDPSAGFPEVPVLAPDPLITPRPGATAVHIWNPARD